MEIITSHYERRFRRPCLHGGGEEALPRRQTGLCRFPGKEHADFFVESTAYTIETERLRNIDVEKVTRLIIVDNRNPRRLGKLEAALGRPASRSISTTIIPLRKATSGERSR